MFPKALILGGDDGLDDPVRFIGHVTGTAIEIIRSESNLQRFAGAIGDDGGCRKSREAIGGEGEVRQREEREKDDRSEGESGAKA